MNADPESIAILIADDDADDRLMAKEASRSAGWLTPSNLSRTESSCLTFCAPGGDTRPKGLRGGRA